MPSACCFCLSHVGYSIGSSRIGWVPGSSTSSGWFVSGAGDGWRASLHCYRFHPPIRSWTPSIGSFQPVRSCRARMVIARPFEVRRHLDLVMERCGCVLQRPPHQHRGRTIPTTGLRRVEEESLGSRQVPAGWEEVDRRWARTNGRGRVAVDAREIEDGTRAT